jgi:hypothetical protein
MNCGNLLKLRATPADHLRAERIANAELRLPDAFRKLILLLISLLGWSMMVEPVLFQTAPVVTKGLAVMPVTTLVFELACPSRARSRQPRRRSCKSWPACRSRGERVAGGPRSEQSAVALWQPLAYMLPPVGGV